jgi:hypothetical protein
MTLANRLSKSRYTKGLRCPRALYLSVHHYDLASDPSTEAQARMDMGTRIHDIAHGRYPDGVLIDDDHFHFAEALAHTQAALDAGAETLFEPAFVHDGVKIRVDTLRRLPEGGWELVELKSTKNYDAGKHLPDAAIQLHVLLGAGIDVRRVTLLHMNGDYVYPGGAYDPQELFAGTEVTQAAIDFLARIPADLEAMMLMLAQPEPPEAADDVSCTSPYECEFFAHCHRDELAVDLDAPAEYDQAVVKRLDDLAFPLHFVDFETLAPALPLFVGTRPYETTRVQWSIHSLHTNGVITHAEWLVEDAERNPDEEFMDSLLRTLPTVGTFVHYSPYERTQMVDIACLHPRFRPPLVAHIPGFYDSLVRKLKKRNISYPELRRPTEGGLLDFDLGAQVVKDGCFHPVFGAQGKGWTIKSAIKVLAPDLPAYDTLAVGNGAQAMMATAQMLDPATDCETADKIRAELLEYCAQDTMSMVLIYQTLAAVAGR